MNLWIHGKNLMKHHCWKKDDFYSNVNMDSITDVDYMHTKRVCNYFEIKNFGDHHDLYIKSNTLLLADIVENFRKMCSEIYQLDPPNFFSAPELA